MTRPCVSVVMPFAGDGAAATHAVRALLSLRTRAGDERILADNVGTVAPVDGITVVATGAERSPAHARNAGAERAQGEWILFLDADCLPPPDLIDAYFEVEIADDVGALAGEVVPAAGMTLAGRYGATRSFLGQEAHLAHPYRPRAAAANLLVRRQAFQQVGGFFEGVRAGEDTDFSWRLQELGWRLELRSNAAVEHRYRATVGELRRQWRGYAAGRAWLARRYRGFRPEPAVRRALRRMAREPRGRATPRTRRTSPAVAGGTEHAGRERWRFLALDALLSAEELAGFALSNRPRVARRRHPVHAVLVAERFPAVGDPLVELARAFGQVRVEAAARPSHLDVPAARELTIDYREDEGLAGQLLAGLAVAVRHPWRCLRDLLGRPPDSVPLRALAPAVRRIESEHRPQVVALGSGGSPAAERIARLAGRRLDHPPPAAASESATRSAVAPARRRSDRHEA